MSTELTPTSDQSNPSELAGSDNRMADLSTSALGVVGSGVEPREVQYAQRDVRKSELPHSMSTCFVTAFAGQSCDQAKDPPPKDPPSNNLLVNDPPADRTVSTSDDPAKALDDLVHHQPGVDTSAPSLKRDEAALRNVRDLLFQAGTSEDDKLRAAGVLAANGQTSLTSPDGGIYKITREEKSGLVSLTYQGSPKDKPKTITGTMTPDGKLVKSTDTTPAPGSALPHAGGPDGAEDLKKKAIDKLFDPSLSSEDKLKHARDMAHNGQRRFKGPDGNQYEISTRKYGDRETVVIHMNEGHKPSHPILRGIIEKDGRVTQQQDPKGKKVDIIGDWAKEHNGNNPLLHHVDLPKVPSTDGRDRHDESAPPNSDLDNARARLTRDVKEKVQDDEKQEAFLKQITAFEDRAKTQSLSDKQVTDTYNQLSRLLEATEGKAPDQDRVLAAESFAHHMADPRTMDQGQHNTCNMTSLAKREMFVNPATMAEMVATTAITGHYIAKDGKEIKIDEGSLVPGAEERRYIPYEPGRSYATQLMNLAMINDELQRRMPPEYYSQERVAGVGDTGERVRYADGNLIRLDSPGVHNNEIQEEGTRLEGQGKTLLVHTGVNSDATLAGFSSKEELISTLNKIKADSKPGMPVIILVDANDPIFNGSGDPETAGQWHVLLVSGFDESTGKVELLNQWGRRNDKAVSIEDLYRSTQRV